MAIFRPTLGPITQSFGNLTASKWKDKTVLKQKVPSTNTSNSPAQRDQRIKFRELAQLGGILGPALRIGFKTSATSMTEQNVFQSVNKKLVVLDDDLVATILYDDLSLSQGSVEPISAFSAEWDAANRGVKVTWEDNANGASALPDDLVTLVFVDTATMQAVVKVNFANRTLRGALKPIPMPQGLSQGNIVAYAFAKRANSTATSPTVRDNA